MVAELIVANQPCIALTGAGISTESGVPDFRSASGLWAEYDPYEVASIHGFLIDPARAWEFYGRRLGVLADVQPNAGHLALAALERDGLLAAVITQNVDGLHQRAGSREVIEVHGSIATASCLSCGRRERREDVVELLPLPPCADCGTVLKPDVVMFGELLPARAVERASELACSAGSMLVVGSSLEVWPAAGLPLEAQAFATVNRDPTPYDARAALVVHAGAGEVLARAGAALSSGRRGFDG